MGKKNILFLGFGDLATRISQQLPEWTATGVARSSRPALAGVRFWQMAVTDERVLDAFARFRFDAVVVTLTPAGPGDEGYRSGYCEPLEVLCRVWREHPPGVVFFVSSTSVYGQEDGGWVDEESPAQPSGYAGQRMLEAEALVQGLESPVCILRFAGIYGPGRDYLLRQVGAGQGGDARFTNRIHVDDGAAAVAWLVKRQAQGLPLHPLYLVCDSEPAPANEVRAWIASALGLDPAQLLPGGGVRGGNKRCRNTRLLETGFRLRYPGFRDGYRDLIRDFR